MSTYNLVSLETSTKSNRFDGKILLLKPPYFTPWTPPLGIAILKSYMESHGYSVTCYDYNTDPELWGMHHKYFSTIRTLEDVSISDGYSKLWWILNAHMLAYANGASAASISRMLETIVPLYGIRHNKNVIEGLIPVVDRYFKRLQYLTDQLDLTGFSIAGTSTYTTSLSSSLFILQQLKRKYPGMKTVMGGGIFADDFALGSDNLETLLNEYDYIDHVVLGEGEKLFLKLVEGELAHKRVITIKDLLGKTLDMKDVPIPDFSDLNVESYYHLSIEGARSCPFQCSFCSETIQWGDYRKKPFDQFADQVIELSRKFNVKEFFMGDSLMNPYINPFATELIKRQAGVLYDGYLRADKPVTNRKFVKLWADSGLFRVRLGIESAASKVLKSMDKKTTPAVISDVLKTLANAGIRTTTYWIVGFPGETEEDFNETCDFIREHHRFIYELEAHPYYYYPYGQVGSRLYQCYSLYPEEVTNLTRFRVWEIINADPPREVRYDRLRRISKLAADLGLPNIYSMAERYQAEDRWRSYYPLAVEIYHGNRTDRAETALPRKTFEQFSKRWTKQPTQGKSKASAVLCYRTVVKKKLDEIALRGAIEHVVRCNEMLQLNLHDGQYVVTPGAGMNQDSEMLVVDHCQSDHELDGLRDKLIESISAVMLPERGRSMRVALVTTSDEGGEILLFVHRAMADATGAALLLEDLFRAYEQLANSRGVSLLPVEKTYTAFIDGLADSNLAALNFEQASGGGVSGSGEVLQSRSTTICLDRDLTRRVSSISMARCDLNPAEVFVAIIRKLIAQVDQARKIAFDAAIDFRSVEATLERTVGPLARIYRLPTIAIEPGNIKAALDQSRDALRKAPLVETGPDLIDPQSNTTSDLRVLLNLEFFHKNPWLGGDEWEPKGFWRKGDGLAASYDLEVTPAPYDHSIQVCLNYRDNPEMGQLVETISARLSEEMGAALDYCERQAAAKEFWFEEFGRRVSSVEPGIESEVDEEREWDSITFNVEEAVVESLGKEYGADLAIIVLAAFGALLHRLDEQDDLIILSSLGPGWPRPVMPLRLYPSWKLGFNEFVDQVEKKIARALPHADYAFDMLFGGQATSSLGGALKGFDAQYEFKAPGADDDLEPISSPIEEVSRRYPSIARELKIAFEAIRVHDGLSITIAFDNDAVERTEIARLGSLLVSVLKRVASNGETRLEELVLDSAERGVLEKAITIEELAGSFSF